MQAFLAYPMDTPSDYVDIRMNGMWYQEWQSGYDDILRRGYARPKHRSTILAELYSPNIPDFLYGGDSKVPFLVSERTRALMRANDFTGIRFSSVEIAKIATKGTRKGQAQSGEPEEQITKAKKQSGALVPPRLFAVRVTGRMEVVPDYPSGRCPDGCVTPYDLPKSGPMPDLWRPTIRGRTLAARVYCSQRFRDVITAYGCSNIRFVSFQSQMSEFRRGVEYLESIRRRTSRQG